MFEYFRTNYTWNFATIMTVGMGGQMSEVDEACRALRQVSDRPDAAALEEWHQAWARLADRIAALAADDEKQGFHSAPAKVFARSRLCDDLGAGTGQRKTAGW